MIDQIVNVIGSARLRFGTESALQADVCSLLAKLGECIAEYQLRGLSKKLGRIDFYLPAMAIGIECKVAGSVGAVVEQLQRYASSEEISGLVLVTKCRQHMGLPIHLAGKPLRTVWVAGRL